LAAQDLLFISFLGHHLYCLKPKLKTVPSGDWYCSDCKPKERVRSPKKTVRRVFSSTEEDTEEDEDSGQVKEEDSEEEEEDDEDFQAGLAIKNPPKKTHLKNPTKNGFFGFLKFLIFYENKMYKLFSLKQIFYEQIRHNILFIYKKIVRYALN
jgi:hypothetical protein